MKKWFHYLFLKVKRKRSQNRFPGRFITRRKEFKAWWGRGEGREIQTNQTGKNEAGKEKDGFEKNILKIPKKDQELKKGVQETKINKW